MPRKRWNIVRNSWSLVVGVLLVPGIAGCVDTSGLERESAKWRTESDEWQKKFEGLQKESQQWQEELEVTRKALADGVGDLSTAMVEAADSVDPIAMKEIYRDNKTLTEIVEKLRAAPHVQRDGTIVIGEDRLRFRIHKLVGTGVFKAWIDQEDNLFMATRVAVPSNLALPSPPELQMASFGAVVLADRVGEDAVFAAYRDGYDRAFADASEAAKATWGQYVEQLAERVRKYVEAAPASIQGLEAYDLQDQLLSAGTHTIRCVVNDPSADFEAMVVLERVRDEGDVELIGSRSISSRSPEMTPVRVTVRYDEKRP